MAPIAKEGIQESWRPWREEFLLAVGGGFIDTLGFIALFGLFPAAVTGNLAVAGAEISGGRGYALPKLFAIPVFMASVAATTVWIQKSKSSKQRLLSEVMAGESLWLAACMGTGIAFGPTRVADSPHTILIGMLAVIAMGMRNAASRLLLPFAVPSTVMTGNIVQLTILATSLVTQKSDRHKNWVSFWHLFPVILGFITGAALGAAGYSQFGFASMILPISITTFLAVKLMLLGRT
jgi:uncharacterized membrane protein YoaK (UPF0700 family)